MAKSLPIIVELDVPNDAAEILSFTNSVIAKINQYKKINSEQQGRIKMILIELVTNSIKHGNENIAQIKLVIDQPSLTIQKSEKGLHIKFSSNSDQIPFTEIDQRIKISFSEENRHHIQTLDKYKFKFLNPYLEGLTIEHMPEHFGFYIITMASDSFIYQYDPEKKENSFLVHLNL